MTEHAFGADSPEATERLAGALGFVARPGLVIGLIGTLGAGKTTFARGLASGLGVPRRAVTSPTFTLIQQYEGRLPITHVDVYRLGDANELIDLGIDELLDAGVCLVEWADRCLGVLPDDRLLLTFEATSERSRRVAASASGAIAESTLAAWARSADRPEP